MLATDALIYAMFIYMTSFINSLCFFQSNVPVDLLDLDTTTALVSYTRLGDKPVKNNAENFLLATYRCQADTSRLEVSDANYFADFAKE